MRFLKVSTLALFVAASPFALAQSDAVPMKVEYERTQELPDGVAFHVLINRLKIYVNNGDRDFAAGLVAHRMNMDESSASPFLDELILTQKLLEDQIAEDTAIHACSEGEAYRLLDQMYAVEERAMEQHYERVINQLDKTAKILFENWISMAKTSISYSQVDFEEVDRRNGTDSTTVLTDLCRGKR